MLCKQKPAEFTLKSPDAKIAVIVANKSGMVGSTSVLHLSYSVSCNGLQTINPSELGISLEDQDFTENLNLIAASKVRVIDEHYSLKAGKKLEISNLANEQVFILRNSNKGALISRCSCFVPRSFVNCDFSPLITCHFIVSFEQQRRLLIFYPDIL